MSGSDRYPPGTRVMMTLHRPMAVAVVWSTPYGVLVECGDTGHRFFVEEWRLSRVEEDA